MIRNVILTLIIFLFSYNQHDSNKEIKNSENDSAQKNISKNILIDKKDSTIKRKVDTILLLNISTEILKSIKIGDYKSLASFTHSENGICFSPYANIDTTIDRKFTADKLTSLAKQHKLINWHSSWEDAKELLTVDQYFKKFVYDVDFLSAPVKSINKFHSHGTDINNINEIFPKADVVEFYFPGFEKKLDGMDFRGLRLVFEMYSNKSYLVAIVHDEWTP